MAEISRFVYFALSFSHIPSHTAKAILTSELCLILFPYEGELDLQVLSPGLLLRVSRPRLWFNVGQTFLLAGYVWRLQHCSGLLFGNEKS